MCRGHLAAKILQDFSSINSWIGYDICSACIEETVCKDRRYEPRVLNVNFYNTTIPRTDVLVASHVIEHFDHIEVIILLGMFRSYLIPTLLLELPLRKSWHNYKGGHVLELNERRFIKLAQVFGYTLTATEPSVGVEGNCYKFTNQKGIEHGE